jgi:hypothetical protein
METSLEPSAFCTTTSLPAVVFSLFHLELLLLLLLRSLSLYVAEKSKGVQDR